MDKYNNYPLEKVLQRLKDTAEIGGIQHEGLVPMTPSKGLLTNPEAAAVMTYVRNSIGHQSPAISAENVAKVRSETKAHVRFYRVEQLFQDPPTKSKEHLARN